MHWALEKLTRLLGLGRMSAVGIEQGLEEVVKQRMVTGRVTWAWQTYTKWTLGEWLRYVWVSVNWEKGSGQEERPREELRQPGGAFLPSSPWEWAALVNLSLLCWPYWPRPEMHRKNIHTGGWMEEPSLPACDLLAGGDHVFYLYIYLHLPYTLVKQDSLAEWRLSL